MMRGSINLQIGVGWQITPSGSVSGAPSGNNCGTIAVPSTSWRLCQAPEQRAVLCRAIWTKLNLANSHSRAMRWLFSRKVTMKIRWGLWVLALTFVQGAASASESSLEERLRHCSQEADEHPRVQCFDAIVNALPKIKTDQFGMNASVQQHNEAEHHKDAPDHKEVPASPGDDSSAVPVRLSARISALRQDASGDYVFTLDNGQTWQQAEPELGQHFEVGDDVQIEHGLMSAMFLSASHHRRTRVRRVR
jgi:hypothetical protein